ncbi:MAG: aminoacyl-tRNA hydrolase [Candidatus Binataceae bacterium]
MSRIANLFGKFRPRSQEENPPAHGAIQWVIAGLGNPGEQYRRSRHNLGFMAVRRLAAAHNTELSRRKFNALYGELRISGAAALLMMPQAFYNRSGESAASMLGYFKIDAARLIVVHDEMDLSEGQLRVKRGGGDAGNRGVRSIIEALGTPDFIRVRIGVSHAAGDQDGINHVLKPLDKDEMARFEPLLDRASEAVLAIMRDGLERAMNIYNQRA